MGPRFQGVKMVPPGPHIVSYASSGGRGDLGPTTAFFLHVRGGQVVVRRWDAAYEVLAPLGDEDEVGAAGAWHLRGSEGCHGMRLDGCWCP